MAADEIVCAVRAGVLAALLCAATISDLRTRTIPDGICGLIALAGLIFFGPARLLGVIAALPLLVAALLRPEGMGGGDIKLTVATGLHLGFLRTGLAVTIGLCAAVLYFGLICATHKKGEGERPRSLPLAPFLTIGFLSIYFFT